MGFLSQIDFFTLFTGAGGLFVLYSIGLIIYRLFFHPLAQFPGSRLAAITYLYEAYYVIWKRGKYTVLCGEQHEKYGPLLRINPDEIHIKDPNYYEKIFHVGSKFEKSAMVYEAMGPPSIFSALSNEDHRMRRDPLNPFFSRRNILRLEDNVRQEVEKFLVRLEKCAKTGEPLDISAATRAVAFDAVTDLCFEFTYDAINREDLGAPFMETVEGLVNVWMMNIYMPGEAIFTTIFNAIPPSILEKMDPGFTALTRWLRMAGEQVQKIASLPLDELEKSSCRPSIFKDFLRPESRAILDPSVEYMSNEAFIFLTAGGETVGSSLTQSIFGVLRRPDVHKRLIAELKEAFPNLSDEITYMKAEALPYLSGVVKEGLRLSDGVSSRLPRIVPASGMFYKDTFIPPGTRVSMSNHLMHNDKTVFPEPRVFRPERWLGPDGLRREKYLVAFSKGSRACLGQNLALLEIYLMLANTFRRFEMELHNVDEGDMVLAHIYFSGLHGKHQRHCQVFAKVRSE